MSVRYLLELAVIFPAALFAVLPARASLKYPPVKVCVYVLCVMICLCVIEALVCAKYSIHSWYAVVINGVLFPLAYIFLVNANLYRKLFCLLNSAMLCELCTMYTRYIIAPYELADSHEFTASALHSLLFLGSSVIVCAVFFRTLTVKLPALMNEERIAGVWRYMFLAPLVMTLLMRWMTPLRPFVVMTGRVRPVAIVLVTFVMISAFMFYHIFWWTTQRLTESARLQQENTFLQMEAKRYEELKSYMNYSRTLRHDFRQHILIINHLTESGQIDELKDYLSQFTASMSLDSRKIYCANPALDALAAHYDLLAESQQTQITWRIELPQTLTVNEADFCAMLGNLTENALNAVRTLPPDQRKINVMSSMLSDYMTGISIDNTYTGKITFGKNGLPFSGHKGHGIGLISVKNTVNRYGGSMNITAKDGIFSVDIILYSHTE